MRNAAAARTILLPFDRPRPVPDAAGIRVLRPRRFLHRVREAYALARPAGALSAIAQSRITILPYQLEPALLMRRDGVARVMVADAVGLGKTIQAGIILSELAADHEDVRALIVVPAGLRDQWSSELAAHFGVDAIEASSIWLARAVSQLPTDVNPWGLSGVYIASMDLIKRPEVLRPLEDVTWDAVIVDEAHEANRGTARRAAIHAVACRARRVVLLTATPHGGDARQFGALCGIGAHDAAAPAIVMFRRSRPDVEAHGHRRTRLFSVRLSADEQRMHRLLERYTSRLCAETRARGDAAGRLVAVVLRKRALSSAASLAASCRRRRFLLEQNVDDTVERQLPLPLADEDPLPDVEPDAVLGARGFSDTARERLLLDEIARAADRASRCESKIRFLERMLRRIHEPAIVFTEYRDTLERLRQLLLPAREDLQLMHGGMDLRERATAQAAFTDRASLLLATDAASEGLNLHARCRLVIHFELPWSPARLEQRTGRVDRIGQTRRVHEALLVANDTAERLVLAPLVARATRSRSLLSHEADLADALAESRIAAAVIEGTPPVTEARDTAPLPFAEPPAALRQEAIAEAARVTDARRLATHMMDSPGAYAGESVIAASIPRACRIRRGLFAIYELGLFATDGCMVHRDLRAVHFDFETPQSCRTFAALRTVLERFCTVDERAVREQVQRRFLPDLAPVLLRCERAAASSAERERAILQSLPSAARQLVQAGLFDQRAIRASGARQHVSDTRRADAEERLDALAAARRLERSVHLRAVLLVAGERP